MNKEKYNEKINKNSDNEYKNKTNKNLNKKKLKKRISKSQTKPITEKNLQEIICDDYIENVKNFKHYYKDLDIMTKYIIKSTSKNYIYYYCN